jgi:hypothetical protein
VFEEDDVTPGLVPYQLNAYCSNGNKEVSELETDVSVRRFSQWRAHDMKVYHGTCFNQWGAYKEETANAIENGEQVFVAYYQRMLIAVLDSALVFDPGGQYNTMKTVNQNILVQQ